MCVCVSVCGLLLLLSNGLQNGPEEVQEGRARLCDGEETPEDGMTLCVLFFFKVLNVRVEMKSSSADVKLDCKSYQAFDRSTKDFKKVVRACTVCHCPRVEVFFCTTNMAALIKNTVSFCMY